MTGQTRIIGSESVQADLVRMRTYIRERVKAAVYDSGIALQRHIVKNKLRGQVLKRRTGKLAESIALDPPGHAREEGGKISIRVGTNVVYGKLWELGGTIRPYTIRPKGKAALYWKGARHPVKVVNMPGRTVAARPFLVPALNELRSAIRAKLTAALTAPGGTIKRGSGGHH